jgi:hypothetical protein
MKCHECTAISSLSLSLWPQDMGRNLCDERVHILRVHFASIAAQH